jgi:hypothetical protein
MFKKTAYRSLKIFWNKKLNKLILKSFNNQMEIFNWKSNQNMFWVHWENISFLSLFFRKRLWQSSLTANPYQVHSRLQSQRRIKKKIFNWNNWVWFEPSADLQLKKPWSFISIKNVINHNKTEKWFLIQLVNG